MKVKKIICMLICLSVIASSAGCEDNKKTEDNKSPINTISYPEEEINIDLTSMSSTMVYSEVYNIMCTPEEYVGKMIRMNGLFSTYHDENTGNNYFACIIQDATACCAQGIEFILTDDYSYPDDYPEEESEITVTGILDTYEENDYTYCTLRNAILEN